MFPIGKNSQVGWDLGNRMDRGYRFDAKWACPMGSYAWGIQVFCSRNEVTPHFSNRRLEYLRHNWADSFRIKPITPGHPIPKISTRLTIFWGGIWKTEFVKTIHRQERTIIRREIRLIPQEMLNRILSNFNVWVAIQQRSAWNEHSINYWKSIVKHYWF